MEKMCSVSDSVGQQENSRAGLEGAGGCGGGGVASLSCCWKTHLDSRKAIMKPVTKEQTQQHDLTSKWHAPLTTRTATLHAQGADETTPAGHGGISHRCPFPWQQKFRDSSRHRIGDPMPAAGQAVGRETKKLKSRQCRPECPDITASVCSHQPPPAHEGNQPPGAGANNTATLPLRDNNGGTEPLLADVVKSPREKGRT